MHSDVEIEVSWSKALLTTHLALSEEDLKFRNCARQSPDLLRRSTFSILDGDPRLKYPQQPWVTFVGRAKIEQLRSLSLAVADLIRSVPRRIFNNDPAKICNFYSLPSREVTDIVISEPNCIEESIARADLIDTADGFKCIEFNFTPNVGGWETSLLVELHRKVPETMRLIEREGLRFSYTSTLKEMFLHIIRQVERWRLSERGELNIACVINPEDLGDAGLQGTMELFQRELDEACRIGRGGLRGKLFVCSYSQLIPAQGKVFFGKTQAHVILELGLGLAPAGVYRCFKAGNLLLFNGPISEILSDKQNLALLWQYQDSGLFDSEEREVIRKHIPWTRRVAVETVEFQGQQAALPDLLASARDRLVLKEGRNYGGNAVFLGRFTPEARWEEIARKALENGGWVVQEQLESLPYLYQCGEYGCAPHDVIWGPFVFGSTYGGVILRMQPKSAGGAVNASLSATEGIVLEV